MAILIIFFAAWAAFAMWANGKKLGITAALGGGFIIALLSLFPAIYAGKYLDEKYGPESDKAAALAPALAAPQLEGLGVDYDHLMTALAPFTPELKPAPSTSDGRTRMLGRTQGGSLGMLEISGKSLSQSVEKATLAISISKDNQASDRNGELLSRYLAAIYPDWNARTDWALAAIQAGKPKTIEQSGKRISFSKSDELKMFIFVSETI